MATSRTSTAGEFIPRSPSDRPLPLRMVYGLGRFARRKPLGFVGLLMVLTLIVMALFAGQIAPYAPNKIDLRHHLEGPSSAHWLGTDAIGRDVLSRLIFGARISMTVGFGAVAISSFGAAILGITSGYFGGWFDKVLQRFVDSWQAMPFLIILITFMGVVKRMPNVNVVLAMVVAIGVLSIAGGSRVIRSQVLTIKNGAFVEAAQSMGAGHGRIMLFCILPNVFPLILVSGTVALGGVILAEASLSFLGFGPAGEPSWGQMLSVDGREYMRRAPGLAVYPGLCIGMAVFGFNIFGDALRDVLDPRLRGGGGR
jgi:peptide/nickel transport system permease protein